MEIVYESFKLVPTQDGTRFDLLEKVSRKKKDTKESYEDWKTHGYDMTFELALHNIAMINVKNKKNNKELSPEVYIKSYRQEKNQLLKSLKNEQIKTANQ